MRLAFFSGSPRLPQMFVVGDLKEFNQKLTPMLDAGCSILDIRCSVLDAGCSMLDAR
jgi:hypothetical protein